MKKAAVIIENRPLTYLQAVIDNHMSYLPGWDLKHFDNFRINSPSDYNRLMTDISFWSSLNYDKILIFQHDSKILRIGVDDFLDYSYVGAPWKADAPWSTPDRRGGNGGISIRDVKEHIRLLNKKQYNASKSNEDVFFSHNLENVAPYEVCTKFGVETEFKLGTFSYHAINKYLSNDQCNQIINQYRGESVNV